MLEPLCSRIIAKAGLRFAHLFSPFCSLGVKCFHGRPFSSQASMDPNLSCAQIRDTFVNYFIQRRAHKYVHSSSVIPHEDPTLLFANAGMNQVSEIRTHFHCPSSRCNVCVCTHYCTIHPCTLQIYGMCLYVCRRVRVLLWVMALLPFSRLRCNARLMYVCFHQRLWRSLDNICFHWEVFVAVNSK